jgi:hypothetical protein
MERKDRNKILIALLILLIIWAIKTKPKKIGGDIVLPKYIDENESEGGSEGVCVDEHGVYNCGTLGCCDNTAINYNSTLTTCQNESCVFMDDEGEIYTFNEWYG